jgi:hypothetical protein
MPIYHRKLNGRKVRWVIAALSARKSHSSAPTEDPR